MKRILLLLCLCYGIANQATAQGIDFFKGDWDAALEMARSQDKLIFVDAYAVWCGPCKKMAATVFPDEKVGAFYNRNFVSVKMDMEAPENAVFRDKYPVAAFPTLFFINAAGEVVQSLKGALAVDAFISAGEKAMALSEPSEDYAEQYADGNREPELVYKYVRALVRNQEPHLKVANDYLRTQTDLESRSSLQLILLAATEADSRIFEMMTERKAAIIAMASADLYYSQVYSACETTATKAIEYSSPELLAEAIAKMDANYPDKAKKFAYTSEMAYAKAHRDGKTYARAARAYAKDIIAGDAEKLNDFALEIANTFPDDQRALEVAEYAANEAIRHNSDLFQHYYTLAIVEKKMGNAKLALAAARKARVLAETTMPTAVKMLTNFIEELEKEG